ncbi:efflux transporter outer membrane subunit [Catenovulum sediminis]|uniref:Efflux transporter outer membrane subunit n=1 Tax=Catenovulum sediminis TaxID=1740262 RepID=A0ABV1RKM5_9ALTE
MKNFSRTGISSILVVLLSACQSAAQYNLTQSVEYPDSWQTNLNTELAEQTSKKISEGQYLASWLQSDRLLTLIEEALQHNQNIQKQKLEVEKSRAYLARASAALWPDLNFSFSANRSQGSASDAQAASRFNAGVSASYQIDVWGKLNQAEQAAQLNYQINLANLKQAELDLVSSVTNLWFEKAAAMQVYALYQQRYENVKSNLEIIESGYQSGLNRALDVYLTRNDLENEKSRLLEQQERIDSLNRQLNLLLGGYPSEQLTTGSELQQLNYQFPSGVPAELIKRRPDVQKAWLAILVDNAELAIAHKNRFPSFSISASLNDSQSSLSDLFKEGIAWSLGASLFQPIFDAGNLKAAEQIAELELNQSELSYLQTLYAAFEEVETALSNLQALQQRLTYRLNSKQNAEKAEQLAFEQYLAGISSYSTYLEAQRRAYDARSQVIDIKKQIVVSQIQLHQSLGGDSALERLQRGSRE